MSKKFDMINTDSNIFNHSPLRDLAQKRLVEFPAPVLFSLEGFII